MLLHVVDISHSDYEHQMEAVNGILAEIGAADKPTMIVFNKIDIYKQKYFDEFLNEDITKQLLDELKTSWMARTNENAIFISAVTKENIDELRTKVYEVIKEQYNIRYPYKSEMF